MKTDLDRLMQAKGLDAILVSGPAQHNPPMVYLTGWGHLTSGNLLKQHGAEPILFHNPMERDEAARTGLAVRDLGQFKPGDLLKQANGDHLKATIQLYQQMLAEAGFTAGRMAVYGKVDAGSAYAIFSGLQAAMPGLEIVGEVGDSILLEAMATKDAAEVERIRRMGQITTQVVGQVADYLTSQRVENGALVKADGEPLTIGDVKRKIQLWLAERGAEAPEGVIFAIGRDAGVPHSSGTPQDSLRLGQTIVFDIFPCEPGGGYYYDFTRTWCLGYAPDQALALYEDVLAVFHQIMDELQAGAPCQPYQVRACELFEARGHPTVKSNPLTQEGYVHGLGHGIGLNIHEQPRFSLLAGENDHLAQGVVMTVEPGLYYPERGLGVRLEDSIWVRPDGEIEVLAEYPLDLVLPVRGR
jgi:Xaa-Pro aminopeptidase